MRHPSRHAARGGEFLAGVLNRAACYLQIPTFLVSFSSAYSRALRRARTSFFLFPFLIFLFLFLYFFCFAASRRRAWDGDMMIDGKLHPGLRRVCSRLSSDTEERRDNKEETKAHPGN